MIFGALPALVFVVAGLCAREGRTLRKLGEPEASTGCYLMAALLAGGAAFLAGAAYA